jgi:hypothetical protein
MTNFKVYEHPVHGIQLVKEGFSWPVLAICSLGLGCVYFAVKRLWILAIVWFLLDDVASAVGVLGVFAGNAAPAYMIGLFHLAFMSLVPAVKANAWAAGSLEARGFVLKGSTAGATPDAALANYAASQEKREPATATTTDMPPPSVKTDLILHQDGSVKRIPFIKDTMIVGRKPDCDIVIDESYISGRHAKIERRSNRFFVTDIVSTNGTLVNGQPISSETWISENDSVQLGEVTLRIAGAH